MSAQSDHTPSDYERQLSDAARRYEKTVRDGSKDLSGQELVELNRRLRFMHATLSKLALVEIDEHYLKKSVSKRKAEQRSLLWMVVFSILVGSLYSFFLDKPFFGENFIGVLILGSIFVAYQGILSLKSESDHSLNKRFKEMYERDLEGVGLPSHLVRESVSQQVDIYLNGYDFDKHELASLKLDFQFRRELTGQLRNKHLNLDYIGKYCEPESPDSDALDDSALQ